MTRYNLTQFGVELHHVKFKDTWDWLVSINDCKHLLKTQPTYLFAQILFILAGVLTFIHSLSKKGRWPWFWLACFIHGIFIECLSIVSPDIDNFWHSQTPVMLFGSRLPLYILFLYPTFVYNAAYAASRLNLSCWIEPLATGLLSLLIEYPYDVNSIKFVHWTWHDTDPNIADRHYWVPWNSFYFYIAFNSSLYFWFHFTKNFFGGSATKWQYRGFFKELGSTLLACLFGIPGGIVLFAIIYHPLHDSLGLHSEVSFFVWASLCLALVWSSGRTQREKYTNRVTIFDWLLVLHLIAHYTFYIGLVTFGNPENEISTGFHEPIGPCNETVALKSPLGHDLTKKKYLCPTDYDEEYFTFSCLPKEQRPTNGAIWYTVCGTPFENRYEYIVLTSTVSMFAAIVFYNIYFGSSKIMTALQLKGKEKQKIN